MDIRHVEFFVAVAEESSFTRAAERVLASQSTVSAGIRVLERELGAPLFERSARRVALTPAGELALPEARALLEAFDGMREAASEHGSGARGLLRLGVFSNLQTLGVPAVLQSFRRRFPLVDLRLATSPAGSSGFADDLRAGRVDVAFMGLPTIDLEGLEVTPLASSEFVGIVAAGHPLARRRRIRLAELVEEPFVDGPVGFGTRVVAERILADAGLARTVPTQVAGLEDIPAFVAQGFGVGLLPRSMVRPAEGAVVVPLAEHHEWSMSIVTRAHPARSAAALRDHLVERGVG